MISKVPVKKCVSQLKDDIQGSREEVCLTTKR